MKVYHQNQGEGRANTSLCPRQLVPLELLLKDPECDCRTYADPYPKDTDRRTLRPESKNFCFSDPFGQLAPTLSFQAWT